MAYHNNSLTNFHTSSSYLHAFIHLHTISHSFTLSYLHTITLSLFHIFILVYFHTFFTFYTFILPLHIFIHCSANIYSSSMGRCEAERVWKRVGEMGIGRIHKCETNHNMQEWLFMEAMVVYIVAVITKRLILMFVCNVFDWSRLIYCMLSWQLVLKYGNMSVALYFGFNNSWCDAMQWWVRCFSSLLTFILFSSLCLSNVHVHVYSLSFKY